MPTNHETLGITYNHRFIISDPGRETPLVWSVSKVEDTQPIGLVKFKFTQETFDPTHDNAELGICNYYDTSIEPQPSEPDLPIETSTATITYSGTKPTIKVGGSWKTFTPTFSDESITVDKWVVSDENGDISYDTENYTIKYYDNQLKLKVAQNYSLIGKLLTIQLFGTDKSTAEVEIEVI